jgi:hypothetical protein
MQTGRAGKPERTSAARVEKPIQSFAKDFLMAQPGPSYYRTPLPQAVVASSWIAGAKVAQRACPHAHT